MLETPHVQRFDFWDVRTRTALGFVPYVGLVVAVVLTLATLAPPEWPDPRIALVVSVAAAGWVLWMFTLHPSYLGRPVLRVVAYVCLLAFCATLVLLSPWFGFFSFCGYLYLEYLPGKWLVAGVAATAVITATSQVGGLGTISKLSGSTLLLYGVIILFNLGLGGGMTYIGWRRSVENDERRQAIADLTEANRRLEEAMEENAGLHAQLLVQAREAGITDERQRIAREIHDTLAQGLAGIVTQIQAAQRAADRPDDLRRHLDTAATLARDSLVEARRTVTAIRPGELEQARLPDALAEVAEHWSGLHGVRAEFTTTGDARPLHPAVEAALLRTTQEALANVAKHAAASRVGLTLSYMEDVVTLDVRDDGAGFDPAAVAARDDGESGYGLTAMRQRMRRLTGRLHVESEPGGGTAISASVPAVPVGGAR